MIPTWTAFIPAIVIGLYIAWRIVRAGKQIDDVFGNLDAELRDRQYRRGDR
jgi:uncharacterized membrane-anchored protein YhcB (DUF1043 family)